MGHNIYENCKKQRKEKVRMFFYNVLKYIVIDYNVSVSKLLEAMFGLQFDVVFSSKLSTIIIVVSHFCDCS